MALSNAEKQRAWRERHIRKRRDAQRIAHLLVRQQWPDVHIAKIATLLNEFFSRHGMRELRRELRRLSEPTEKEKQAQVEASAAYWHQQEVWWQDAWLREHPGRTRTEYNRSLRHQDGGVWQWRRAKGHAAIEAERRAWEADHPGEEWQEHQCAMSDREYTDYARWERQRARRLARTGGYLVTALARLARSRPPRRLALALLIIAR